MTAQAPVFESLLPDKHGKEMVAESSDMINKQAVNKQTIDKQSVAASFSAAAVNYDNMAAIQKDVGRKLLDCVRSEQKFKSIADIGCGTGWLTGNLRLSFPEAYLLGMDLAEGMIEYANKNRSTAADHWWVADMEALPVFHESFDLLISNLAMQWLQDPHWWFMEASRVLVPGGRLLCSTLLPGTLCELKTCWDYADQQIRSDIRNAHINHFTSQAELMHAARAAGFEGSIDSYRDIRQHSSVRELMAELKGIGANNLNSRRPRSVTSKGRIRLMLEHYEQFRTTNGYPATYEVALISLTKSTR